MSEFKLLYVLVSGSGDLYYEQLLISVTSARKHMPNANICLLTDNKTKDSMVGYRAIALEHFNDVITVNFPGDVGNKERSRYLKTSMREKVTGDFLYIDCDTLICEDFGTPEFLDTDIGAVVDCHAYSDVYKAQAEIRKDGRRFGFKDSNKAYFNGGVLWAKDSSLTHEFFKKWHALYSEMCENGITIDQVSLNQVNQELGNVIHEIDGKWNCLAVCGARYLSSAKIIHYVGAGFIKKPAYRLSDKDVLTKVKNQKNITSEVCAIIDSPKTAYRESFVLPMDGPEFKIVFTGVYKLLMAIYNNHHGLFCFFNNLSNFVLGLKMHKRKIRGQKK